MEPEEYATGLHCEPGESTSQDNIQCLYIKDLYVTGNFCYQKSDHFTHTKNVRTWLGESPAVLRETCAYSRRMWSVLK